MDVTGRFNCSGCQWSPASKETSMPSGQAYVGAAYAAGSGFAVAASGQVYGTGGSLLGAFPLPVRGPVSSGSTIAAPMAASGIGLMDGATTGSTYVYWK